VQFMAIMLSGAFGLGLRTDQRSMQTNETQTPCQVHYQHSFHLFAFPAAATNIHLRNGIIQRSAQISFQSKCSYS